MLSSNSYSRDAPAPIDNAAFEKQLNNVIKTHWNSPAIVQWVIFNEGQGYYDARGGQYIDVGLSLRNPAKP